MTTITLVLAIFITCFGSSMLYGYNMSVINLPAKYIKCFLTKASLTDPTCENFGKDSKDTINAEALYGSLASIFVVSGTIGAFASGIIADVCGRKVGLLLNHIPVILGGVLIVPAFKINSVVLLFVARFLIGLNCGVSIAMASMYLTEISPKRYRGAIGACHQLAVTLGIAFGYVATMKQTMKGPTLWPYAAALTVIPAALSAVVLPFLPESPRYLYLKKNNADQAKLAYRKFNNESPDEFVIEMETEIASTKDQPKFHFTKLFTDPSFKKPMIIACTIQIMQQLSGINAVITYSSTMLKSAGVHDNQMDLFVLIIGLLNVVCTVASLPLIEKLGRRTLLLFPTLLIIGALIVLPISVVVGTNSDSAAVRQGLGYFSTVMILVYIVGFAFGLGPIPGLIVSEIFTQGPRGAAYSVSQGVQWLSNLVVQQSYPIIDKKIGGYSFLPFLIVVVVFWIMFFFIMPETKGKSFEQISKELQGKGFQSPRARSPNHSPSVDIANPQMIE